jgi:hypothetical protein
LIIQRGKFPAVANSAQSQVTRELAPLPMNFSVLVHFTHLGKSVGVLFFIKSFEKFHFMPKISSAVIPTNLLSGNLSDNALSKSFPIKPCGNDMYIGRMKRHNNLEHTIFSTKMLLTFGESKNGTKIR